MNTETIQPMMAHAREEKKEQEKKSKFIESLISMDWKGIVAVILFTAPIFWTLVFNKVDERYLRLDNYKEIETQKATVYQRDQADVKSALIDIRQEQREQRALIIQGIRDTRTPPR